MLQCWNFYKAMDGYTQKDGVQLWAEQGTINHLMGYTLFAMVHIFAGHVLYIL